MPSLVSLERVAGCLMLGLWLGGCGSVALQPSGPAGTDGGAAGSIGSAGSGPAGQGGSGTAGQTGTAGTTVPVSPGVITLRLGLPPSPSFCDMSCGGVAPHITILTLDKKPLPIEPPSCTTTCSSCQPTACPVGGACLLTGVAVTGAELKWDGRTYPFSSCGGGTTCYEPTFVPAGRYIAHMCATPGKLSQPADGPPVCTATGVQSCTDVEFAFPGGGIAKGSLSGVAPTCGVVRAADYDQSCKVDSDCVLVGQGDFCQSASSCAIYCPSAAISAHAQMQYLADTQTAGAKPIVCSCPEFKPPACVSFKCVL
ncbi:MAG: hypothetical protein JWM82_734 [Myxococcales bacterium]|nr:hypothetical protein [Myxococcales bacterium]